MSEELSREEFAALKQSAYRVYRTALKNGTLVRPKRCEKCGRIPPPCVDGKTSIHGHHTDYNKPLDVEWICVKCHRIETPVSKDGGGISIGEANGQANGQAKLTGTDVLSAKRLRLKGLPYSRIAARFSVDKKTIMRAIKGEQWAHIPPLPALPEQEGGK